MVFYSSHSTILNSIGMDIAIWMVLYGIIIYYIAWVLDSIGMDSIALDNTIWVLSILSGSNSMQYNTIQYLCYVIYY